MNTIPFDVDKAKAGARVVTRAGSPVRIITYELNIGLKTIAGVVNREIFVWNSNGKYLSHPYEHRLDLFLQEEPKYVPFAKAVPLLQIVKEKNVDCNFAIVASNTKSCFLAPRGWVNYGDLLANYIFEDGSPCGTLAN